MDTFPLVDERFMDIALATAREAGDRGEVPVGAVLVQDDAIIANRGNAPIEQCDPTAHAEILALRDAGERLGNYRLTGTTLYVTLEPCPMCVGAMIHARIDRLVFGAADPRTGAAGSRFALATAPEHNHRLSITGGIRSEVAGELLRNFFRDRRRGGR